MKTVTLEQIMSWEPCWLEEDGGEERLKKLLASKTNWSALDILALEDVSVDDKFWAVLRTELIDEMVLHEFACRCAETALALIDNPNPASLEAIAAKRKWMRGEITDEELSTARSAAYDAASSAAWSTARYAASLAASLAARSAAWYAAYDAASSAARYAAYDAARSVQATMLIELILGAEKQKSV